LTLTESTIIDHRYLRDPQEVRRVGSAAMSLSPRFLDDLRTVVGDEHLVTEPERLATYDCDGLTGWRAQPAAVVLPGSAEEVQGVLRLCARDRVPFVARGAGTGLSGGALPVADGIVVSVARMNRILEVDVAAERVVVEPGVANLDVTRAVAAQGYFYAPDPSSQQVCTIGGNVAENSGGAHCLKHGFTVNHVTGAKVVLPDGELLELGGKAIDGDDGPDLLGVIVGSEGTLGIAVEVTLRIVRQPEAVVTQLAAFTTVEAAGDAVSQIVAGGILPAAMEIMDRFTIQAAEEAFRPGYPEGAGSVLLVELDGRLAQVEEDVAAVDGICRAAGAFEIRTAHDAEERALLWKGRKGAFAAMGRVSPDYYVQDGVVPRTRLPAVLRRIDELSEEHGLRVGNVFHAGDGNLHPLVLYDGAVEGQYERAKGLADEILAACVEAGGSLTGEHGIGVDKACAMPSMFSERDLEAFERVRRAFDPDGIANPGKVIPTPRLCGEVPGPYRMHPLERLGLAERF
jgi:glycolate oxidase